MERPFQFLLGSLKILDKNVLEAAKERSFNSF